MVFSKREEKRGKRAKPVCRVCYAGGGAQLATLMPAGAPSALISVSDQLLSVSSSQAQASMAGVEEQLRGQLSLPWSGVSEDTGSSSNTPEETDDVDNSSLSVPSSVMVVSCARVSSPPPSMGNGTAQPSTSRRQEADSSSEACAGPQPPQEGKLGRVRWCPCRITSVTLT